MKQDFTYKTKNKSKTDKVTNVITSALSWIFSLFFIALFGFIIYSSIPGFQEYGIVNILFSGEFNLSENKASVWFSLCITFLTTIIAILIAEPIGVKTAIFIKYRVNQKYQKTLRIIVELLAGAPSVIFGLFAAQILGKVTAIIFGSNSSYTVLTASFMLTFMILPTIISLSLNAFNSVDTGLLSSAMVLGNSKTRAIYKVCKKECKNKLIVATILAISRAIGETMAVGMILQSQQYANEFGNGLWSILNSGLRTLGAFISANMFSESVTPAFQGLLFAFGLIMFVFVILLNLLVQKITRSNSQKNFIWSAITFYVGKFVTLIPTFLSKNWERISYTNKIEQRDISKYIDERMNENKFANLYTYWKVFWEYFSIIFFGLFIIMFFGNILIYGIGGMASGNSSLFDCSKDTTGQAFVNTLIIIIIAIGIGLPLSLGIAIYINEFAKESKMKRILIFFIDSLGATPSILFGMFGMVFFLQMLGISSNGQLGKSLLAGALTIIIVILPTFIRTIQQALESVPKELRTNSYALGAGKWETIHKIVLPKAFQGIMASVVLSIGRILAETAPLFLTSGLSSSSQISVMSEGQTLTTRIYAQIFEPNIEKGTSIMYECALVTMIMVLLIILLVHVIIPWYSAYKKKKEQDQYDSTNRVKKWRKKKQSEKKKKQKAKLMLDASYKTTKFKKLFNNFGYVKIYTIFLNDFLSLEINKNHGK